MPLPIIEDFAAIHARLRELQTAPPPEPAAPPATEPPNFYHWLMGGALWLPGA